MMYWKNWKQKDLINLPLYEHFTETTIQKTTFLIDGNFLFVIVFVFVG